MFKRTKHIKREAEISIVEVNRVNIFWNLRKCYQKFASTFIPVSSPYSYIRVIFSTEIKGTSLGEKKKNSRSKETRNGSRLSFDKSSTILHATFRLSISNFLYVVCEKNAKGEKNTVSKEAHDCRHLFFISKRRLL